MMRLNRRWLGWYVVAITVLPTSAGAQTTAVVPDKLQGTLNPAGIAGVIDNAQGVARSLFASSAKTVPQATGETALPRGKKIAIGAAIGAGIGVVVGEYWFGRGLDIPHGPDMLLGAGLGAGLGALIGLAASGNDSGAQKPKSSVTVVPVLSLARKSLGITLALR